MEVSKESENPCDENNSSTVGDVKINEGKVIEGSANSELTEKVHQNESVVDEKQPNNEAVQKSSDGDKTAVDSSRYGFDGVNHTYTDPRDNTVYLWDRQKNGWFPKIDDDFLAQYQMNYGFTESAETPQSQPQTSLPQDTAKEPETKPVPPEGVKRKATPQEPGWFEMDQEHNTKVYVSNLPADITETEFVDMMQKCGLIMKDLTTGKWRVKLYTEPGSSAPKGDGLCTYIKKESVDLALTVLDGSELRGKKISVERAKFQMKGTYNPSLKPKKKRKREKEKEKKIQEKLFEWRPEKLRGEREKHERTVIVKNLFEPQIFDDKMELILEYTQDLREECSKCGTVRKVVLYDKHPEGVAQVTFSDAEEADICIKLLNNRWFGQRRITAATWDGKTKYRVTETEEEEKTRRETWNKYLETGEAATKQSS